MCLQWASTTQGHFVCLCASVIPVSDWMYCKKRCSEAIYFAFYLFCTAEQWWTLWHLPASTGLTSWCLWVLWLDGTWTDNRTKSWQLSGTRVHCTAGKVQKSASTSFQKLNRKHVFFSLLSLSLKCYEGFQGLVGFYVISVSILSRHSFTCIKEKTCPQLETLF